jgi:general secretion pathway protein A
LNPVALMSNYVNFFGFKKEPFPQIIDVRDIYHFPGMEDMLARFRFAVDSGMVLVITGSVGSGKSTFLRYACSTFHPSKHRIVPVIANSGSYLEVLRQIALSFDIATNTNSIAKLTRSIRQVALDIFSKKITPVLVLDEAHLMREAVFREIHTVLQPDMNSDKVIPMVLSGQFNLIDKLKYHTASALASRVMGKAYLEGLDIQRMAEYLTHHLKVSGIKNSLFDEAAVLAIHQGSSGTPRKANHLARGSLLAAAMKNSKIISPEHVRLAATELL